MNDSERQGDRLGEATERLQAEKLRFCTRCGHEVENYGVSRSLGHDEYLDYFEPLASDALPRHPDDSTYRCPGCCARWYAPGWQDTGHILPCGHFMPVYVKYCGVCGNSVEGGFSDVNRDSPEGSRPHDEARPPQIERLCQEFRQAWQSGSEPELADYLGQVGPEQQMHLLRELLMIDLESQVQAGRTPREEDYSSAFPESGDTIHDVFVRAATLLQSDNEESAESSRTTAVDSAERTVKCLGVHDLLERIGQGGMGVVYRARDTALERNIAIKVLQEQYAPGSREAARFLDESRITGQLQHPSIPPVHQVGTLPDGRPFLAMKLIQGQTLGELLDARQSPEEDRGRFLAIFEQVCQAMAYAHSHGVIHRDLKPSNAMVGAFGEVQVMDWGLAKLLDSTPTTIRPSDDTTDSVSVTDPEATIDDRQVEDAESRTQAGDVMGTPSYMPPEQARGEIGLVDRRADVFSLGGILCVLLTGKPPYTGRRSIDVLRQAMAGEMSEAFTRLDGCSADRELVTLCRRCLASDPADRPRDAAEVAEILSAHLEAVEERARQAELARVRAAEQRKRRRVQFSLFASIMGLVVAAGVGVALASLWRQAEGARQQADSSRQNAESAHKEADAAREIADKLLAQLKIRVADAALTAPEVDAHRARQLLDECPHRFRSDDWKRLANLLGKNTRRLAGHQTKVGCMCFNPAGTMIASADGDFDSPEAGGVAAGVIRMWDVQTGLERHTLTGHERRVTCLSFSPDGKWIASGSDDRTVRLWNAGNGREVHLLDEHDSSVDSVRFSSDGSQLISRCGRKSKVWQLREEGNLPALRFELSSLSDVVFSSESTHLAAGTQAGSVRVWNTVTGEIIREFEVPGEHIASLCFSPDGKRIVGGSTSGSLQLWDVSGENQIPDIAGHETYVFRICFSPDGTRIASNSRDGTACLWNATTGELIMSKPSFHLSEFSPDGSRIVGMSHDTRYFKDGHNVSADRLRLLSPHYDTWSAVDYPVMGLSPQTRETAALGSPTTRPEEQPPAFNPGWAPSSVSAAAGGGTAGRERDAPAPVMKVWDAKTGRELHSLAIDDVPCSVRFAADGWQVVISSDDQSSGAVRVWNLVSGLVLLRLRDESHRFRSVCFSPVGGWIATTSGDQQITLRSTRWSSRSYLKSETPILGR